MTTKEHVRVGVEERFSAFDLYDEKTLIGGISVSLDEAFTEEKTINDRINALEIYLAMQYFLQGKRLGGATDPLERDNQFQLVDRFSEVFLDEGGLLAGLFHYCDDNAFRYFRKRELDTWEKWRNLADAIRNEKDARIAND